MRVFILLPLVLTLAATSTKMPDATQNDETYDREGEVAWIRSRWPLVFKDVHLESPVAKLLAWVPANGTVRAYTNLSKGTCHVVEFSHSELSPRRLLRGKTDFHYRTEDGHRFRDFSLLGIGSVFARINAYGEEERGSDGAWHTGAHGSIGLDDEILGALSYVDGRVARFDGEPLFINPICSGPYEWLPCASGGERPCDRCEQLSIELTEGTWLSGHGFNLGDDRRITCDEPCPQRPTHPDIPRLREFTAHVTVWRPRKRSNSVPMSLYRSLQDCLRENQAR